MYRNVEQEASEYQIYEPFGIAGPQVSVQFHTRPTALHSFHAALILFATGTTLSHV